jgi:hypothetical protein
VKWIALVLALALLVPAGAAAKGPASGTIAGPGLDRPIELTGIGEPGSAGTLGRVVEHGGLFAALGGSEWGTLLDDEPADELGPRYAVTFTMRDGESRTVRQDLYPYARPLPVTYTPEGQRPFGTGAMGGGWYVADERLLKALVEAGLPAEAPAGGARGFELPPAAAIAPTLAVALGLAAATFLLLRRRDVATR